MDIVQGALLATKRHVAIRCCCCSCLSVYFLVLLFACSFISFLFLWCVRVCGGGGWMGVALRLCVLWEKISFCFVLFFVLVLFYFALFLLLFCFFLFYFLFLLFSA